MVFGVLIIGDEILSGRHFDKHFTKVIELLRKRGLSLAWAEYIGDNPAHITATLKRTFASNDIVFSTGGIGATPDDHTRQCAAAALNIPLELHPQAKQLIIERMRELSSDGQVNFDLPESHHQLHMGVFPKGASIIPNGYNKFPGFSIGTHHFVPGFPMMAWPMIEWVLDTQYAHLHHGSSYCERSFSVFGLTESVLVPLMERIEADFPGIRVFSLPSVSDSERSDVYAYRRHIDLGVKGDAEAVNAAFIKLRDGTCALGGEVFDA